MALRLWLAWSLRSRCASKDLGLRGLATTRKRPVPHRPGRHERGQRMRRAKEEEKRKKLTEAERNLVERALGRRGPKNDEIWSDDPAKLWAYRRQWIPVAVQRAAPLVLAGCVLTFSPDARDAVFRYLSPVQIEMLYGASMLPTIHPYGDIWLHTTPLWDALRRPLYRLWGRPASSLYQRGDVVVYRDPVQQRRTCKRIIGVEGDTVRRHGEHADYYAHRPDRGIRWETLLARGLDPSTPWDDRSGDDDDDDDWNRTLVVPPGHVWLEGDNPLVCVDSRHYGPVPMHLIEGRLVWRLYPLLRAPNIRKYDQMLRKEPRVRPPPLDVERPVRRGEEDVLAVYYNLHRQPKDDNAPAF